MQLSVVNGVFGGMSLDESLKFLADHGVHQLELGVGGYPGTVHADAKKLIHDQKGREELMSTFKKYNSTISAIAVHGNCVHPNKEIAAKFEEDFEAACVLAGQIGIKRIVTFSGCPGGDPAAQQPNWVTCAWPPEYLDILDYQWNQVGPMIGANLDPSHLIWQGMDIVEVIHYLGDAIYYFHAKDTEMNMANVRKNGVLDTKHYGDFEHRSWVFRTLGYGTDNWRKIISALKIVGYDDSISIEHEDGLMQPLEGLEKAISYIQPMLIVGGKAKMWWA